MPKKRLKKVPKKANSVDTLRKALAICSKAELIDNIVELAKDNRDIFRGLGARLKLEAPPEELAVATRRAIADATDFDERDVNYNFDYDSAAYDEVKRHLSRLVELRQLPLAMELSLELMKQGSYQVEMSDEGLMTDDIEECLAVVVKALQKSSLPPGEIVDWCKCMMKGDSVGFVYDKELRGLKTRFEASV